MKETEGEWDGGTVMRCLVIKTVFFKESVCHHWPVR